MSDTQISVAQPGSGCVVFTMPGTEEMQALPRDDRFKLISVERQLDGLIADPSKAKDAGHGTVDVLYRYVSEKIGRDDCLWYEGGGKAIAIGITPDTGVLWFNTSPEAGDSAQALRESPDTVIPPRSLDRKERAERTELGKKLTQKVAAFGDIGSSGVSILTRDDYSLLYRLLEDRDLVDQLGTKIGDDTLISSTLTFSLGKDGVVNTVYGLEGANGLKNDEFYKVGYQLAKTPPLYYLHTGIAPDRKFWVSAGKPDDFVTEIVGESAKFVFPRSNALNVVRETDAARVRLVTDVDVPKELLPPEALSWMPESAAAERREKPKKQRAL